jgi:hypothetical protein
MLYPHLLKPCRGKAFAFYVVGYTKIFLRECFALNLGNNAIAWKGKAFGEKNPGWRPYVIGKMLFPYSI